MTERFFKNNPNALRHCLLYHFYLTKQPATAYIDFQRVVCADVIEQIDFQFYWDQFEQCRNGEAMIASTDIAESIRDDKKALCQFWINRLSDGRVDNREKTDLLDVLRCDKYALRACVLSDAIGYNRLSLMRKLLYIRSFFMYQRFCKILGDDVMEYREYDFWFYRFINGGFDLNYERDEDEKTLTLFDMPVDVMKSIMDYMSVVDRSILAKTSKSLRDFLKTCVFHLQTAQFVLMFDTVLLELDSFTNEYMKVKKGCMIEYKEKYKLMQNDKFWKLALTDFYSMLTNSKIDLESLTIALELKELDYEKVFDEFDNLLKNSKPQNIKNVYFKTIGIHPILRILPYLKPGFLERINVKSSESQHHHLSSLVETEHWKLAKHFKMTETPFDQFFHHLFHFESFDIRLRTLSVMVICHVKEILFKSPHFDHGVIRFSSTPVTSNTLKDYFGEILPDEPNAYHYTIPDSKEYFLIHFFSDSIHFAKRSNEKLT